MNECGRQKQREGGSNEEHEVERWKESRMSACLPADVFIHLYAYIRRTCVRSCMCHHMKRGRRESVNECGKQKQSERVEATKSMR